MTKGTEHLQEVGGARGQLRPRVEGQPLKIAETVLRKRRQDLESREKRAEALAKAKKARKKAQRPEVKTAQYFVKKALLAMKDSKRLRVQRNRKPKQQRKPECRVYCVVRNHRRGGCRETQEALKALGLPRPYSCTLIANDENATKILRKISPFVFYGLPSAETIRRLFVTRARLTSEDGGPPVALSDNMMVEEAFGSLGLFCVEDLVHEVVNCGPHFPQVMQRVGHFQLESLKQVEELEAKRLEYGYIRNKIDMKVAQLA